MIIHGAADNDLHPPLFGATQRLFGLYRGLARGHDVRVLCVVPNRNRAARRQTVEGVTLLRRKAWYTAVAWRLERARLTPLFLAAHGHRSRAAQWLAVLEERPDVLMTDLSLGGMLERSSARLRVHHAHNVEVDHFRLAGPKLLGASFWCERLKALEARAVRSADLVVAVGDEDAARLESLYGIAREQIAIAPNGYDETQVQAPTPAARERVRATLGVGDRDYLCVFIGSDVPHNRQGLSWILDRVMPDLAGLGFKLLVIGRIVQAIEGRREPWLITHAETSDPGPLLGAADAGLNPVLAGGGSNVKLPTYLAAGLAVVTTPHGMRGYPSLGPWALVATPENLAEAVRRRPAGWARSGSTLPAPVAEYAWGRIGERLGERFEEQLGAERQRPESLRSSASGGRP